ncbi:MAG TPA: DUF3086 domain-containing protein, partial [Thermosynechococcaceae cyanobacterium]
MNSDELQADLSLPEPLQEPAPEEPIGIQEASVQALAEQEQGALVEPEEAEIDPPGATLPDPLDSQEALQHHQALQQEVAALQETRDRLQAQIAESQMALGRLVQDGLSELEQRKQLLQVSIEQLECRRERVRNEMQTSFAGVSQDVAIRVQSFKDYLVGSLQDLALSAEQLDLQTKPKEYDRP